MGEKEMNNDKDIQEKLEEILEEILKALKSYFEHVGDRFTNLNKALHKIENKLDKIGKQIEELEPE